MGIEVMSWPSITKTNDTIIMEAMEMNPKYLGSIHVEPYYHNCDQFWTQYFN
jgi:hypothetical protein